jgi:hypothetical protein
MRRKEWGDGVSTYEVETLDAITRAPLPRGDLTPTCARFLAPMENFL